jgi:hypothetical protein
VLRLTGATPFSTALTGANTINIYMSGSITSISPTDVFTGGFYTDQGVDFSALISGATINYYLAGTGSTTYNGISTYGLYTGPLTLSTVSTTADFGSGPVNGYSMQFSSIPEPQTYAMMLGGAAMLLLLQRRRSRL